MRDRFFTFFKRTAPTDSPPRARPFAAFAARLARVSSLKDRARRGVAAIEFALIAPIFFMLLMGVVEVSLVMLCQHLLENAAFNASRLAKTGYVASGKTQLETITAVLHRELGSLSPLIDTSKITLSSTAYASLSLIGQTTQGTSGLGGAEQIVVYTVSYPWHFFTPLIGNIMGDANQNLTLTSRIVVRNEPY